MNYIKNGNPLIDYDEYPEAVLRRDMPNYLTDDMAMKMHKEPQTGTLKLFPIDEGFWLGTIFSDLYKPYKNLKPRIGMPTNEREKMLHDVDKYFFGLHEMRMYLNAYPNNQEAINTFVGFQENYIKAKNAFEKKFGALDIEAPNLNTSPWNWTVGKWPWESEK